MELNEVLQFLNIDPEKATDLDTLKTQFNTTFVSRAVAVDDVEIKNQIIGKRIGALETKAMRMFKGFGVEFTGEEKKDKKLEDLIELGNEKLSTVLATKETELKSTFESTKDETVIKLTGQIDTFKTRVNELEGLNQDNLKSLSDAQLGFDGKIKEFKLNSILKDAHSKLKIRNDASDFEKAGFNSVINSKYKFELGEKDSLLITDTEGNRIKNESGNDFATFGELLTMEAKSGNLLEQNNANGSNANANAFAGGNNGNTNNNNSNGNGQTIALHPNAMVD